MEMSFLQERDRYSLTCVFRFEKAPKQESHRRRIPILKKLMEKFRLGVAQMERDRHLVVISIRLLFGGSQSDSLAA
jgi:hypothetical protein